MSKESIQIIKEAARTLNEINTSRDPDTLHAETASRMALLLAALIIDSDRTNSDYVRDAVELLCEITANEDRIIARQGVSALFPSLIERLNDSFEPEACAKYDQVFAQVIDFYRRLPEGKNLDEGLQSFRLMNETDLLNRKSNISNRTSQISTPIFNRRVKKVLVLSRVTIGADVAITSVIIAKLREILPHAEFVLIGSPKLHELFGGDERLRIREIGYERSGGVLSRLMSWLDLVAAVAAELRELNSGEWWLIDPDSRLSQLGLLPLLRDESNYFFFESRSYRRPEIKELGALASQWIDEVFGAGKVAFPYVALPKDYRTFGQTIGEKLRRAGATHLISISLGVGGNPRKRISDSFEEALIQRLIKDTTLIIDKGASAEEHDQVNRIVKMIQAQGKTVLEIDDQNAIDAIRQEMISANVLTWTGGIGAFAALIAASDEFIGYDSASQHIAAALGIPTLTIFVNSNSQTFADRWRPYGSGIISVLNVDAGKIEDETQILSQAMTLHQQLRER